MGSATGDQSPDLHVDERRWSPLLAGAEQGNGPIDATLPGIGALGGGDVGDVIPLHAAGQLAEECAGSLIGRERGGEVGGHDHLLRGVGDGQGDTDGVSAVQPGGLADGGADADHMLAAHHADRVPVLIPVDVDQHGRAVPGRELLDGLLGDHDPGVVAGDGNGCLERHAARLGCHRLSCLSPAAIAFLMPGRRPASGRLIGGGCPAATDGLDTIRRPPAIARRRGMAGPLNLLGHVLGDGPEGGLISVPMSIRHPEGPPIAFMSIRPMSSSRAPSA